MYITIEGPEATGKSTQAKLLAEHLKKCGLQVFLTKEPGTPHDDLCVKIRALLLDPNYIVADRAALFLFLADRAQHIERVSKALAEGKIVISDRSSLSTYVYHIARERDHVLEQDIALCHMLDFAQQISPDVCFVFNSSLDWSLEQMKKRETLDRIERFDRVFHERTHKLFSQERVVEICQMLTKAPKVIAYTPSPEDKSESEISAWVASRVDAMLDGFIEEVL